MTGKSGLATSLVVEGGSDLVAAPIEESSTKALSGHSLGAAGVQEAIYTLLMLKDDFICASANIQNLDPEVNGYPVVEERRDNAGLERVMSNSFGFGGTNATLVFSRVGAA